RPRNSSDLARDTRRGERLSLIFGVRRRTPATSFFQGKTDFQRHLPVTDFSLLLDASSGLGYLKPSHVADCLLGACQCISYRLLEPFRRRTNYFNLFVNVIRHTVIMFSAASPPQQNVVADASSAPGARWIDFSEDDATTGRRSRKVRIDEINQAAVPHLPTR